MTQIHCLFTYGFFISSLVDTPFFCLLMCPPFSLSHFPPPIFFSSFISFVFYTHSAYLYIFSVESLFPKDNFFEVHHVLWWVYMPCPSLSHPSPFTSHVVFPSLVIYSWWVCSAIVSVELSRRSSHITE